MSEPLFLFEVPQQPITKIDSSHLPTATELLAQFPHLSIVVLDFALRPDPNAQPDYLFDSQDRFLATRYYSNSREIINIDHHNELAATSPQFSTTHQVISAIEERMLVPATRDRLIVVNHDDTDSILALLLATHANVPSPIKDIFAEAAKSADHTGTHNQLVNLIDSFYRLFDLPNLVPLINAFLNQEKLIFPSQETANRYHEYEALPPMIIEFVTAIVAGEPSQHGTGVYDRASKVLHLKPHNENINTIRVLPIAEQLGIPVSIILTSTIKDAASNWWRIAVRGGSELPEGITLAQLASQLQLEQYGYGGRVHAGGTGRHRGEKNITSDEMFELFRQILS